MPTMVPVLRAYAESLLRTLQALLWLLPVAVAAAGAAPAAEAERPRRVLMVHSFGSSAPPFTTLSTAFESAIKRELGAKAVDLDEISLDMARCAQRVMGEAFAELLGKRRSGGRQGLLVGWGGWAVG